MAGYPTVPENLIKWNGLPQKHRKWPGEKYDWAEAMYEWAEWVKVHLDTHLKSAPRPDGQPDPEVPPPPPPPFPD